MAVRGEVLFALELFQRSLQHRVVQVVRPVAHRMADPLQPLAQHRHARIVAARFQRGAIGDQRPAALRRHLAQFRQRRAQLAIQRVLRARPREQRADRALRQRVAHRLEALRLVDLARVEVPVRVQRGGIDLAAIQVQQRGEAGIGGQQVELRELRRRRLRIGEHAAPALQLAQPVVLRIEAVAGHVAQRGQQLVEVVRARPRRRKPVLLVESRHRGTGRPGNVGIGVRAAPLLDALADLLGHRPQRLLERGLLRMHRRSQQQPQHGDGANDTGKSRRHDTILRKGVRPVIAQPAIGANAAVPDGFLTGGC